MNRNKLATIGSAVVMLWAASVAVAAPEVAPEPNPIIAIPETRPAWIAPYQVRYTLHVVGNHAKSPAQSILAQLPTAGWLRPDASDLVVQAADGAVLSHFIVSHDPAGDTLIQFPRHDNDLWFWVYARAAAGVKNPKPATTFEPAPEGLTLEVRRWAGEDLQDWTSVREGLEASDNVVGNAVVADVIQNCNPMRPNDPRHFAASYRGHLIIPTDGVYRFFLNAEDAAFLFIDGYKVTERVGTNQRLSGTFPIRSLGADVELTAGVHPLEVHHVMGNNPTGIGYCALMWVPPGAKNWTYIPRQSFAKAGYAQVAKLEHVQDHAAAQFVCGIDDTLRSGEGELVYLVRFEAVGALGDEKSLVWDFGDGTTGAGRSLHHVYFNGGDYQVSLRSGDLPAYRRNVHVWPAPGNTSPFSLRAAVESLSATDWKKFDAARLNEMFQFLLACEQPERWPLVGAVAQHILDQREVDFKTKVSLYGAQMDALANQGRAAEALALGQRVLPEFARVPSLQVGIKLKTAEIYQRHLKKVADASQVYEAILNEHRRVEHPNVRLAAIRWGDLFAEAGDMTRAGECYRLAAELGGESFTGSELTGAATRGGLLRTAEQKLRSGDVRQTRQLLERIELNFPQQKLEGLYRLLRADADRQSGHYEEALRNYEILLKLTQWAGFNDRALHGVADTYYRLGDLPRALTWLDTLEKSFPKYYEQQQLAEYRKLIEDRQARAAAAKGAGAASLQFIDQLTRFEPDETESWGKLTLFKSAPGMGIAGAHVGLCAALPTYVGYFDLAKPLPNIVGHGEYWVELWYREMLADAAFSPHLHFYLFGETNADKEGNRGTAALERTFGAWRKLGFLLRAPLSAEGRLAMTIRQMSGVMEIDGVSIRAVSDRQADALNNFLKGSDGE